jgi:hypothetical protein
VGSPLSPHHPTPMRARAADRDAQAADREHLVGAPGGGPAGAGGRQRCAAGRKSAPEARWAHCKPWQQGHGGICGRRAPPHPHSRCAAHSRLAVVPVRPIDLGAQAHLTGAHALQAAAVLAQRARRPGRPQRPMDMQLRIRTTTSSARAAAWPSTAQTRSLPRGCFLRRGMLPRPAALSSRVTPLCSCAA